MLEKTKNEGWRWFLFHSLLSFVTFIGWSLEGSGLFYIHRHTYLWANETRLSDQEWCTCTGRLSQRSVCWAGDKQALCESLFRGQITDLQAQIKPVTTEGVLTMCKAGTRRVEGRTWSVLLRNLQSPRWRDKMYTWERLRQWREI